jgi:hypothetical protein
VGPHRAVGADVDDAAPDARLRHDPRRAVRAVEQRAEIRVHVGVPAVGAHLQERTTLAPVESGLGVVDQDVHLPERLYGAVEEPRRIFLHRHIGWDFERGAARLPDLRRHGGHRLRGARIDHDAGPFAREAQRDPFADALSRTGHDRHFPHELHRPSSAYTLFI